jgi:1-acyl-sn-glycerol-3-phosphate acyltransferase
MQLLYTGWCAFWFITLYLLLFPIQFICLQWESWKPAAHKINAIWGRLFFAIAGIPIHVEYRFRPDPKAVYVFCANHFSYIDIAVMGVIVDNYFAFIGKSETKRIPLLGYMFAKLHVQVDRSQAKSRAYSLTKSVRTLAGGRSIMIYPEGGIKPQGQDPPQLHPFKDGAFIMAIQQQVPVVPVTLLTNYKILPDRSPIRLHRHALRAVIHPPIATTGMTLEDIERLKAATYNEIQEELKKGERAKE